jgi:predicted SAM-dependent methyltransferase
MWQLLRECLKTIPGARNARRVGRRIRKAYDRQFGASTFRRRLSTCAEPRIVIGAGAKDTPGWIPTQKDFLNLLTPADWEGFFVPESLAAILAEHVWEHLTPVEGAAAAATCYQYLKHGGYLRVAVPDGLHPNPAYLDWVKVGGASPMQLANGHKVLYTHRTLSQLFQQSGFGIVLYEYFDESGAFHHDPWDAQDGKIWRSAQFDPRNSGGTLVYTSIILDAVKD